VGIARKLEDVHECLTKLAKQGKVVGFLTNPENAQRIGDLVGEIDKGMRDYQVCDKLFAFTISNICARCLCNKILITTPISSL